MITTDKVYVINTNDLTKIKSFNINTNTAKAISNYLLNKRVDLHLLCRPGFSSIILVNYTPCKITEEIQSWIERGEVWGE